MNKFLTFHLHGTTGNEAVMLPAYYIDGDYDKVAVRIYAEKAPTRDAKFDIYVDGVSIFESRGVVAADSFDILGTVNDYTYCQLTANNTTEEMAEDFTDDTLSEGEWITCYCKDAGGGKDFTIQLELSPVE